MKQFEKPEVARPVAKKEKVAQKLTPEEIKKLLEKHKHLGLGHDGECFIIHDYPERETSQGKPNTTFVHAFKNMVPRIREIMKIKSRR